VRGEDASSSEREREGGRERGNARDEKYASSGEGGRGGVWEKGGEADGEMERIHRDVSSRERARERERERLRERERPRVGEKERARERAIDMLHWDASRRKSAGSTTSSSKLQPPTPSP